MEKTAEYCGKMIIDGEECHVRIVGYVPIDRPDIGGKIIKDVESAGEGEKCFGRIAIFAYKPIK